MKKIPEKIYRKITQMVPIACVDIIVHAGRRFIMVKRANNPVKGQWWLPGGRILLGETLEGAAKRKAKEELGIEVEIERVAGVSQTTFRNSSFSNGTYQTINICFLARPKNGKLEAKLDSQSSEYKIFDKIGNTWHPYNKWAINKSGILRK